LECAVANSSPKSSRCKATSSDYQKTERFVRQKILQRNLINTAPNNSTCETSDGTLLVKLVSLPL
jgi:hypothetical protein